MKIRRNIASIPVRSARETWHAILDLITGPNSIDADQLDASASVMESLIADEHPAEVPIVVKGSGPRLVIYCLYGENAIEAGKDVDRLSWNPTSGNWRLTAPCEKDDVDWMNQTLSTRGSRIRVHDVGEPPVEDDPSSKTGAESGLEVDWGTLDKP